MIAYNITIKIDKEIQTEWLKWVKNEHIPEVMTTGFFYECKFYRLLGADENEDVTYVIQYFASSFENYKDYTENFSSSLEKKIHEKWHDKFIAFHTAMEIVN